jgi:hypothetical protein
MFKERRKYINKLENQTNNNKKILKKLKWIQLT